jgi:hypothetical protein
MPTRRNPGLGGPQHNRRQQPGHDGPSQTDNDWIEVGDGCLRCGEGEAEGQNTKAAEENPSRYTGRCDNVILGRHESG